MLTTQDSKTDLGDILALYQDSEYVGCIIFHDGKMHGAELRYLDEDGDAKCVYLVGATRYSVMQRLQGLSKYFGRSDGGKVLLSP